MTDLKRRLALASGAIALLGSIETARAAEPPADPSETIIVTGTRETDKKAAESLSPIDLVSADDLLATGQTDLRDALARALPSFTRQAQSYDAGALTDSIQLRGLNPDEVLVLVNGKRRHTTANLNADPGPLQGSAPVDLDMIPISAIDHIEVLRDGAAAQYGSDAIAGVVNIILKSADHGGSASSEIGAYYKGDGFTTDLAGDAGAKLGDSGFLHLSAEFHYHNFSNRTGPDPQNDGLVDTRVLGDPESTREVLGFNAGETLGYGIQLYAFGTYGHREAQSWENFRSSNPDVSTDGAALATLYPNGFAPVETISEDDFSITGGIKGDDFAGWHWDISSSFGGDADSLGVNHSGNVNLFVDTGATPTSFHVGDANTSQWTNTIDISRPVQLGLPAPVDVALGVEHRRDTYSLGAGDPASYYSSADPDVNSTYSSGAQALPGNQPAVAGAHSRNSIGTYIDLATRPTTDWDVDLAGRYEHYSDFGSTENGKLSTRYAITPDLALRGTASTGFRAPSLAEEYYSAVAVGPGYASAQLPVESAAAIALGSKPLKPEDSTNFTVGFTAQPVPKLHASLDAYWIRIANRIVDSADYFNQNVGSDLALNGIVLPNGTSPEAQYYVNGATTLTRGLDLKADYSTDLGAYGQIKWDAALNLNDTNVRSITLNADGTPNLDAAAISYLRTATPKNKIILGATWYQDDLSVMLRETRYGHVAQQDIDQYTFSDFELNTVNAAYITDLEIGYDLTDRLHLAVGADNLFDKYPTKINPNSPTFAPSGWNVYDTTSPFGFNGGFYYGRVSFSF